MERGNAFIRAPGGSVGPRGTSTHGVLNGVVLPSPSAISLLCVPSSEEHAPFILEYRDMTTSSQATNNTPKRSEEHRAVPAGAGGWVEHKPKRASRAARFRQRSLPIQPRPCLFVTCNGVTGQGRGGESSSSPPESPVARLSFSRELRQYSGSFESRPRGPFTDCSSLCLYAVLGAPRGVGVPGSSGPHHDAQRGHPAPHLSSRASGSSPGRHDFHPRLRGAAAAGRGVGGARSAAHLLPQARAAAAAGRPGTVSSIAEGGGRT